MVQDFIDKSEHHLHTCNGPIEFVERFKDEVCIDIIERVKNAVPHDMIEGLFLVGSFTHGLATGRSDIDLIAVTKEACGLNANRSNRQTSTSLVFQPRRGDITHAHTIFMANNVELDLALVDRASIVNLYEDLHGPGPDLSEKEILTLGRLQTGWLLTNEPISKELSSLLTSNRLDIYCATRYYTLAIKFFEKAKKYSELTNAPMAMHFGRLSIEFSCLAFFASRGFPYLGSKWPELIFNKNAGSRTLRDIVSSNPLFADLELLFPVLSGGNSQSAEYIHRVMNFVSEMHNVISEDAISRISFTACVQIYDVAEK